MSIRHTYTTRLLYTVIPAHRYAKNGATLQALLAGLVEDLNKASEEGVEAGVGINTTSCDFSMFSVHVCNMID